MTRKVFYIGAAVAVVVGLLSWGIGYAYRSPERRMAWVAKRLNLDEQQTAKLPSDLFLWAAVGSIAASATFKLLGKDHESLFVGQWAPTFLILGLYNKLVKLMGSD